VGTEGTVIALDRYGASAPYPEIYEQLGLTSDRVAEAARSLLIDGG
jgi:transketolase